MSLSPAADFRGARRSQRQLRVGEEIRHRLVAILARNDLRDPDLRDRSITVSEVRISPDLKAATAYVTPLAGKEAPSILAALTRAAPALRRLLAREANLRHVPSLSFALDESFDEAARIGRLLASPEVARDLGRDRDED